MPYGLKRGIKAPGEFGFSDMFGLALASGAGIIAALVTDYNQKGGASAIYTLNEWAVSLGSMFGFTQIPLWSVIAVLLIVGAGSIFYFQPLTRQGAFAQGFGLLAVMMTAIPADLAKTLEAGFHDELRPLVDETDVALGAHIVQASYAGFACGAIRRADHHRFPERRPQSQRPHGAGATTQ
jgi:hypothetical protein